MTKLKILIVDNIIAVRNVVRRSLESCYKDIEIKEVPDGAQAKAALEAGEIDIVLCGAEIPLVNGDELLFWIRNNERLSHIPFIMMSSKGGDDQIKKALRQGANGYLVKPFGANEVAQKVLAISDKFERRTFSRSSGVNGSIVFKCAQKVSVGRLKDVSGGGLVGVFKKDDCCPAILENVEIEIKLDDGPVMDGIRGYVVRLQAEELVPGSNNVVAAVAFIGIPMDKDAEMKKYFSI
jgi:CheY-like chemotaxis protein